MKNIISNAQSIKPTIGELPQSLAHRLVDSNSKIGQLTFQICEALVTAIGPKAKVHIRTFFPGFFQGFFYKLFSLICFEFILMENKLQDLAIPKHGLDQLLYSASTSG